MSRLNETAARARLLLAHATNKSELKELSLQLASLCMAYVKTSGHELVGVSAKTTAFTALTAAVNERTVLIEFIESMMHQINFPKFSLVTELESIHRGKVSSFERALGESAGKKIKLQAVCLHALSQGVLVPLGESARKPFEGEHVRLMKDLIIIGFIQSFGVSSKKATKKD